MSFFEEYVTFQRISAPPWSLMDVTDIIGFTNSKLTVADMTKHEALARNLKNLSRSICHNIIISKAKLCVKLLSNTLSDYFLN